MFSSSDFEKNNVQTQPNPATAAKSSGKSGNTSSNSALAGAAAANVDAGGPADIAAGAAAGAGANLSGPGIGSLFGPGVEAEFPIAEKTLVKYVHADFFPTDDYLNGPVFPQGLSVVGSESGNAATQQAKILSTRAEPIAVLSQRTLDFFGRVVM